MTFRTAILIAALLTSAGAARAEPGTLFRDCPDCPEMVVLPDGNATGTTLVTLGEWRPFAEETGIEPVLGCYVRTATDWTRDAERGWASPGFAQTDDHPAVCMNWLEATAFTEWLSAKTGQSYRLPTFEESAAAAGAGATTKFWWGDDWAEVCTRSNAADAQFRAAYPQDPRKILECDDGFAFTSPVRAFPANPWGLHDAVGNAWVWTNSCLKGDCSTAIFRGAGWLVPNPDFFDRNGQWADRIILRNQAIGFRLYRDAE